MVETNSPVRILSLGAGVQSTTVLLMMVHGKIPKASHAIFADTRWEPKAVYDHLNALVPLMEAADIKFHKVSAGDLRADALNASKFSSLPFYIRDANGKKSLLRRQCTNQYKLKPIIFKSRDLVGLQKGQRTNQHLATIVIGISLDESQRMRDASRKWMRNEYPLVDLGMTRADCIAWCKKHGYGQPPRSACIGCPFQKDKEWRNLKENRPDEWQDAVQFDTFLRSSDFQKKTKLVGDCFLHRSCLPLDQVDFTTKEEQGQFNLFDMECTGMCGV
jgi:hypothetical protein